MRDPRGAAGDLADVVGLRTTRLAAGGRDDAAALAAFGVQLVHFLLIGRQRMGRSAGGERQRRDNDGDEEQGARMGVSFNR